MSDHHDHDHDGHGYEGHRDHADLHDHTPTAHARTFMWGAIGLGVLLAVVMFTRGFGLFGPGKTAEPPPALVHQGDKIVVPEGSALRARLTVAAAGAQAVSPKLEIPGVVESDPARTAVVLPPASGRVVELKVALGDRVTQGQVLAVIDAPDVAQAYDDDAKAADTLKLTEKNLARQEGQAKIGAASDRDLDQARSDHEQAAAEYARTQARLKVLGGGAGGRSLTAVRAPVAGSITSLAAVPGNLINDPTQSIMTIADLSTIWVTALVPEKDAGIVAKGMDADVSLTAYPGRVLHGKVSFVTDVIEPDSHRNKLRIAFANADYALKPNMFAAVTVIGPQRTQVVVPTSALLMNNDRTSVFVATAPWTFERRTVETVLEEGDTVTIRSGVAPGEQVVTKGGILLND